jgi:hypothetical protein
VKRGLLVTGCGRSGTGFAAKVFEAAGIPSSHEIYFNPNHRQWPSEWSGVESSWLAAPFIQQLPDHVHVVHQVRHPLAVIRSFMGFEFFRPDLHSKYVTFAYRYAPAIQDWDEQIDKCMQYWISWNELVEKHKVPRHRLEDLGPERLQTMAHAGGLSVTREQMQKATLKVGKTYNHRARDASVTAKRLLERPLGPKLQDLAKKYGYDVV